MNRGRVVAPALLGALVVALSVAINEHQKASKFVGGYSSAVELKTNAEKALVACLNGGAILVDGHKAIFCAPSKEMDLGKLMRRP